MTDVDTGRRPLRDDRDPAQVTVRHACGTTLPRLAAGYTVVALLLAAATLMLLRRQLI